MGKRIWVSVLLIVGVLLTSCNGKLKGTGDGQLNLPQATTPTAPVNFETNPDVTVVSGTVDVTGQCAYIELTGEGAVCSSDAVAVSGSTVTVTAGGTYIVSGILNDGQIVVRAEKSDKVELILNGVGITSMTSAAIYVYQADKLILTPADGSVNYLANGGEYIAIDDNQIDAAVFSKDDLTLKGGGTLAVKASAGHGLVSKDDLKIKSGSYIVSAERHGICANDSIEVTGGTLSVTAGKDGLQAEHAEDASLGNLLLRNANLKLTVGGDGLSASGTLTVESGYFDITCGGGSGQAMSADSASAKGLKSTGLLAVSGGTLVIDSADDGVHSNSDICITDGYFMISTGDDGFHADEALTVSGGNLNVTESYEGLEGLNVVITGGVITVVASDDGINAAGGNDGSGFGGGRPGGDRFGPGGMWGGPGGGNGGFAEASTAASVQISGGVISINAQGDGIDSNGTLTVSGGEVYVSGPTSSANGALDFDGAGTITGGIVVAVGASGMAQNFGSSSTQGSILLNVGNQSAGTTVILKNSNGEILVSYRTEKGYSSVVISCPEIRQGEKYTVEAGSYSKTVTLNSLIYGGMSGFR